MRIADSLYYTNAKNDYQTIMKDLYDVNTRLSSGNKIQNSYEDSGVYVDTMRLNSEINTLEQVKESTSKAQTFANNTDTTMNQFTEELDKFKTKLIQASNAANSTTSLGALANDMEAIKEHLISIANTSIDGQFLFSGTALDTKPISSDGTYNGNDASLTSVVGSEVTLPYNIDGKSLFLGKDTDYNRKVSTNVSMYNQTKLYPDLMLNGGLSQEVYLKEDDTIRDMVGDIDNIEGNEPDTVFYLSGRRPNGETFSTNISISSSSKVSDLLESIGEAYGNTPTNKIIDVSLNSVGQIEIKDLKKGNALLEMNLFAAVDRDNNGNALKSDIDDLVSEKNVDIISFNKSNFYNTNTTSITGVKNSIVNSQEFSLNSPFVYEDGDGVEIDSKLQSFMGEDVDRIVLSGTDIDGNSVNINFDIDSNTDVQDLIDEIETDFGVTARLEYGELKFSDTSIPTDSSYGSSLFDISLTTQHDTGSGVYSEVNGLSTPDAMNYSRRGFEKDGNELLGNVSQMVKNDSSYANSSTKLIDVAGVDTFDADITTINDDSKFLLNGKDINGNSFDVELNLTNSNSGSTFTLNGNTYTVLDSEGNPTKADDMTYRQLLDVISMVTANSLPVDSDGSGSIEGDEYNEAVVNANNRVETSLDYKGRIVIQDRKNSKSQIEFSMYDVNADKSDKAPSMTFMSNDSVKIEDPYIDFFKDLDDMIEAVRNGELRMDAQNDDPRNIGVQNALDRIDHIADHVTKKHTKIGSYSNALKSSNDRAELLSINVQTIRSKVADVDLGEAYMEFTQLSNSYQAMLSTIAKINSMSLLNYM